MQNEKLVERQILDFVDSLQNMDVLDDMIGAFAALIARYGYDSFRCAEMVRHSEPLSPQMAFGTLDRDWAVFYRDQDYVYTDSTVQMVLQTRYPFTWGALKENRRLNSLTKRIFDEAKFDFQFSDGLLVPIHLSDGSISAVSLVGEKPDTRPAVNRGLGIAAIYLHSKASLLVIEDSQISSSRNKPIVSRRQLDCIQWVAEGKSDWEISMILGISEATVHNHVERAKRSLGVTTRVQAVVEAARRRLIIL